MALIENYKNLFLDESNRLGRLVLECLYDLEKNPSDRECIERMVNTADVIRGDAKFLQDVNLEMDAKMIITSFKGIQNIQERQNEFVFAKKRFEKFNKIS
jgi:chemotaxis protein histidine kinase CheA